MKRLRDILEIAIVLGVWAAVIAIVNPRGEFPLHDDWDFTVATWNFARSGHFHFTPFTAVSLRAQVLWGARRCGLSRGSQRRSRCSRTRFFCGRRART